jgi:diguanylate cyclase (GGDEF)-like protein
MIRRPLTWYLVAVALAAAAAGMLANGRLGLVSYFVPYLAITGTAFWAAVRRPAKERQPWLWVACCQVLLIAGDAVYPVTQRYHWPDTGVVEAVLWSAGYLAYGIALVCMGRRRAGRWLRSAVLDTLTLLVATGLVIWVAFISPYLSEAASDPVSAYLTVMGPIGDVVILAGVLLIVLAPGVRGSATGLLLFSAVLRIVADLGGGFIPSTNVAAAVGTAAILLGNGLLVGASLHPGAGELTAPARQAPTVHAARPWFLGVGLITAPTIMFLRQDFASAERITLFVAAIVTAMFVVLRFTSALRSLERVERQLSFQARHDPLTRLLNRAALAAHLEETTTAAQGGTLLYLDLDGFKAVNDQAGHAAGDAILCAVADRLRAAVRDGDAVARLGGDEFAMVLHGMPVGEVTAFAERILRDVALPIDYGSGSYVVGASIGIARAVPAAGGVVQGPDALLLAADAAMYEAKRAGRGRYLMADSF